jgi:hypothetical protein
VYEVRLQTFQELPHASDRTKIARGGEVSCKRQLVHARDAFEFQDPVERAVLRARNDVILEAQLLEIGEETPGQRLGLVGHGVGV